MPSFPGGRHSGTVVPLDRANVDTDAIFPKHQRERIAAFEAAHLARRPWLDKMLEN